MKTSRLKWLALATSLEAEFKHLAPLKNLKELSLWNASVTNAGLKELAPLQNLTELHFLLDYESQTKLK